VVRTRRLDHDRPNEPARDEISAKEGKIMRFFEWRFTGAGPRRRNQGVKSRRPFTHLTLDPLENRVVPATPNIVEFPLTSGSYPSGITVGPDGNLWFGEYEGNRIGVINPTTHAVSEFPIPTPGSGPNEIAAGPEGNLWFTEFDGNNIGEINPSTHMISEFAIPTANSGAYGITAGPDGNLWFTEELGNNVGRINPTTHVISEIAVPTPRGQLPGPKEIIAGPDGNLWFSEHSKIGMINPTTLVINEFALSHDVVGLAVGQDGNLWFGVGFGVGEINPATHTINTFLDGLTGNNSSLTGAAEGPDGNVWFSECTLGDVASLVLVDPNAPTVSYSISLYSGIRIEDMTVGPDGNMWITDAISDKIGDLIFPFREYLTALYRTVLNRTASPSEMASWEQYLNSLYNGATRTQIAAIFWQSPEHRGIQVDSWYQTYLHRTESPAERAGWIAALFQSGMNEVQIEHAFLASPEYQASHQSDSALIDGLYHDVLGRQESQSELVAWLNLLSSGLTRDQAEIGFLTCWENDIRIVDNYYSTLLGRPADPGGETAWTNLLLSGSNTRDEIAEAFLASDEFFARATGLN
jgi:streptogramin lyase